MALDGAKTQRCSEVHSPAVTVWDFLCGRNEDGDLGDISRSFPMCSPGVSALSQSFILTWLWGLLHILPSSAQNLSEEGTARPASPFLSPSGCCPPPVLRSPHCSDQLPGTQDSITALLRTTGASRSYLQRLKFSLARGDYVAM